MYIQYIKIHIHNEGNTSQNIQPIERTYSPSWKYNVGSLYSYCIKSLYNCMFNHNKRNKGGRWRQIWQGDIIIF